MSTPIALAADFRRFQPSRGMTSEFVTLLEAVHEHAFIAGGYARYCISPNKKILPIWRYSPFDHERGSRVNI